MNNKAATDDNLVDKNIEQKIWIDSNYDNLMSG